MFARCAPVIVAFALVSFAAGPMSLGGSWKLNLDQSKWGKRDKPTGIELNIENQDPAIRYKGTIINANATDRRDFTFEGAIDGKAYPAEGQDGPGTMTITRVNDWTTKWSFRSNDGKVTEEATTSVSRDGKRLTRVIQRKAPAGSVVWTEVYDKTS